MAKVSKSLSPTEVAYRTIGRTPPQQNSPPPATRSELSL
jgi:hypothetical protein